MATRRSPSQSRHRWSILLSTSVVSQKKTLNRSYQSMILRVVLADSLAVVLILDFHSSDIYTLQVELPQGEFAQSWCSSSISFFSDPSKDCVTARLIDKFSWSLLVFLVQGYKMDPVQSTSLWIRIGELFVQLNRVNRRAKDVINAGKFMRFCCHLVGQMFLKLIFTRKERFDKPWCTCPNNKHRQQSESSLVFRR